jgi:hypothetical protein
MARAEMQRPGYKDISGLQVACETGELVASGRYAVGGVQFPVLAHLQMHPAEGAVDVAITRSQVGQLPIPFDLSTYVRDSLNQSLKASGMPRLQVRQIAVERGSMTIEASPVGA